MRINSVIQPINAELRKIENSRKTDKEIKTSKTSQKDRTEFSSDAQRLSQTKAHFDSIAASISSQPDIRTDKIAEVKSKIESGYYNSEEFIDKLADKLLKDFGVS